MVLGRDIGPAIDIGPAMTRKILKSNGQVVYRFTVRPLTVDEMSDPIVTRQRDTYDKQVLLKLGPKLIKSEMASDPDLVDAITPEYEVYVDDHDGAVPFIADIDDADPNTYDQYVGAKVQLSKGNRVVTGTVKRRKTNNGLVVGKANSNPILDTRTYGVEFPDGSHAEYSANIIAQNMYSQCDTEGNLYLLLKSIVGHKKDDIAVSRDDMYIQHGTNKHLQKTTKGWKLCVKWKDGTTTWANLADLKESYPAEVAEYAIAQCIHDEPAFLWWVPYTIKRRNRIIAAVNARYHKRTHKFGIEIPKTFDECVQLDKANGNTMWQDAVRDEMKKVRIAFKKLNPGEVVPPTYQQIRCHLIFDVKMEDFRRKARYVAGGHMTEAPKTLTYASVVSRESVRIALTLAALNDLNVKTADIENAYLTAPVSEKIWCILGPEFGDDTGATAIIVRSLYGLKSAGASFCNHLADCMRHLGWSSCLADQDLWMKAEVRPDDGFRYYAYALLYVDDILVIHHNAETCLNELDRFFKMKADSIGDPDFYLGAKLKPLVLPNGVTAWGMSSSKYIQAAVKIVKDHHAKMFPGRGWIRRAKAPLPSGYNPDLDETKELDPEHASFCQSQIGVLRWMVKIGRVEILTDVSVLSSQLALPQEGAVFHMFAHLEHRHNARLVFDPSYPVIDMSVFKDCDWKHFYGDVKEAIPPNAPSPRGKEVDIRLFCDSDHAGDAKYRRSRSGYLIYINSALVVWYSKRQPTIETSDFGAEFVAMKQGMEALRGLRYKLRMMGVPISGPSFIYGDNMSVIHNTQRPESVLKKKSNSICYHAIREAVAMGECLTGHVRSENNPADICTKLMYAGQKRDHLVGLILWDIVDHA